MPSGTPVMSSIVGISMKSLLKTFEKNSVPCGIKDSGARYRYVNPAMRELLALPDDFVISGCSDCDIPHPIARYASVMWEEEQRLYSQGENISLLVLLPFGRKNRIQPYIFDSIPHYDENGDLCGVLCYARPCRFFSTLQCVDGEIPRTANIITAYGMFSDRELEIAFFVLYGLSSKEIGRRLGISHRTVENKLQNIYQKTGVNSSRQFKQYCQGVGAERNIPARLLKLGCWPILYE